MKNFKLFTILVLSCVIYMSACKEGAKESSEGSETVTLTNDAVSQTPPTAEPAQNAEGVWHYTCEKGCSGGAGAAGNCATCGGPLAHNQAYHNGAGATPMTPSTTPTMTPSAAPVAEPAQNAAGTWHYTCGKGCAGGAGAAGNCSKCGGPLAHNQAYHQ